MKKLYLLSGIILVLLIFGYNGCSDNSTEPGENNGEQVTVTISGVVFDEANMPVVGAKVSVKGQSDIITNSTGAFLYSQIKVSKDRFVVNVSKDGYFDGSFADVPKEGATSNARVYLVSAGVTQTIDAGSEGTATLSNGSGVKLSANTVANADGSTYSGNVNVSVAYLDPTSENFSNLVPGGDMLAQRTDNSQATLYSYGIVKVEMKSDAGNDLEIKQGSQSEITVDIPPSMVASAPATIPLWHYDKETGLWKEEGTANKQGDKYIGMVGHFSDWNCDHPEGTATVRGLVVDCNNQPVPGIRVKIGQASTTTGNDGKFERRVPANTAFEVQVLGNTNFGLASAPAPVPALAEGTIYDVPTPLEIPCPSYVVGLIRCGTDVKFGQVVISWDGGYNSQFTDYNGRFRLATDINKNATISIYTVDNRYKSLTVTTPAQRGDSTDLGTIQVCDVVEVGDNEFTVNGDGFNNRTLSFSSDTTAVFGYFSPSDTLTYIYMVQTFGQDTVGFWFIFKGNTVGPASEVLMYFVHNSKVFLGSADFPNTAAAANITAYNGVGGLIEGTFNGTLIDFLSGTSGTVTISNGKFSVVRLVGEKQNEKVIKKKIPFELLEKFKR